MGSADACYSWRNAYLRIISAVRVHFTPVRIMYFNSYSTYFCYARAKPPQSRICLLLFLSYRNAALHLFIDRIYELQL